MSIVTRYLKPGDDRAYDEFVRSQPESLFFASGKHRTLLSDFLKAEDRTIIAVEQQTGAIRGVLPVLRTEGPYGPVMNSLPFYGSNGGVLADASDVETRAALLNHFDADASTCLSSTLIESPFDPASDSYGKSLSTTFVDERIGQVTPLPEDGPDCKHRLMEQLHVKTRNAVRKSWKSNVEVVRGGSRADWQFLIETHQRSMAAMGGKYKPECFFRRVENLFEEGEEYRLYLGHHGGNRVAALLVFYFNGTVEYYCPVTLYEARAVQPMSGIIFQAMLEAIEAGCNYWNWGGTWHSQKGVYDFKKKWGTEDRPYRYHIRTSKPVSFFKELGQDVISQSYQDFYVLPFREL